ncbi:hypothetical protein N7492_000794 [Penicillium capsulatum]|uniref:Ankyrin repeat protein n=1 Tax=Penicillium capsulatum TaxID=69766 RepID=A0A9W9IQ88_9EURO|nr:hypothetical protein N7492_000794 [Penicillium capsulatum]KAJ6130147.1 hypothetical protein N7512_002927 [Penicillium capsulatum]
MWIELGLTESQDKLGYILQFKRRIDLRAQNRIRRTILHPMAAVSHLLGCQLLVSEHPDLVSGSDRHGDTPLCLVIRRSHADIYNLLIDQGQVDYTHRNENAQSLMLDSIARSNLKLVKKMADKTPKSLNHRPKNAGHTPLLTAV